MKTFVLSAVSLMTAAAYANPSIDESSVAVSQDSSTRVVTIEYSLSGGPAIVTAEFLTNGVSIGDANARGQWGDVNRIVRNSSCKMYWQPRQFWPNHKVTGDAFSVRLKAWAMNATPDWMVIDIRSKRTADRETIAFYASSNALPDVVNSETFKKDFMLLRKIPAQGVRWLMGSQDTEFGYNASYELHHYVTLGQDYFMPVFQVTQQQYIWFCGADPNCKYKVASGFADGLIRPVDNASYNALRGSTNDNIDWPNGADPHAVKTDSIIDKLRKYTALSGFDLPTDAQWEYACRAGCPTAFYDGSTLPNNTYSSSALDKLAWNSNNSSVSGEKQTHAVGGRVPNGFGLYDMLGNVGEWCLDYETTVTTAAETSDPKGATTGSRRVMRGGAWFHDTRNNRIGAHQMRDPSENYYSSNGGNFFHGFRPVVPASFE